MNTVWSIAKMETEMLRLICPRLAKPHLIQTVQTRASATAAKLQINFMKLLNARDEEI